MLGSIVGDFIGSVHEHNATKRKDFVLLDPGCAVTDDSILTLAVAEWVMDQGDLAGRFHELVAAFPDAGWGGMFRRWARAKSKEPYNSFGNGATSLMGSPVNGCANAML